MSLTNKPVMVVVKYSIFLLCYSIFLFCYLLLQSRACSQFVTCGAAIQNPGVGIALSKRAAGLMFDSGYIGSRIVWVKMRGWMCDMCVIGVYVPHRFRKRAPFQQDTLEHLRFFAENLPPSMCRVILGDFNCKLGRKETGQIYGSYPMHMHEEST